MKDAANRQRGEMANQHLRIRRAVDRTVAADPLESVRHRPGEERHVKLGRNRLKQVIDPLFFDRVDRDDGMTGLNQRLEVVRDIGVRHAKAPAAVATR